MSWWDYFPTPVDTTYYGAQRGMDAAGTAGNALEVINEYASQLVSTGRTVDQIATYSAIRQQLAPDQVVDVLMLDYDANSGYQRVILIDPEKPQWLPKLDPTSDDKRLRVAKPTLSSQCLVAPRPTTRTFAIPRPDGSTLIVSLDAKASATTPTPVSAHTLRLRTEGDWLSKREPEAVKAPMRLGIEDKPDFNRWRNDEPKADEDQPQDSSSGPRVGPQP